MLDLKSSVVSSQTNLPPKIIIYGQHGLGKTTLACSFPSPILINMEKGTPAGIDVPASPTLESYDEVLEWMTAILTQEHSYKTIIFDTLDVMEGMLHKYVCAKNNWDSIETPGFGKGYVAAASEWAKFMRGCKAINERRNMAVVLLAHANVARFDDPTADSYSTYEIRLDKRGRAIVGDLADAILFLNQSVTVKDEENKLGSAKRATGNGNVWAYTCPRPAFTAKNMFAMPDKILIPKDSPYSAIEDYLPGMGNNC